MSRLRVVIGLLVVALTTAWWAGALGSAAAAVLAVATYLLVGLALVSALRVVAPPAALVGPGLLLAAGAGWLTVRHNWLPTAELRTLAALALILGGGTVALSSRKSRWRPGLVNRHVTLLWSRRLAVTGTAPVRLVVVSLFGSASIDLTAARFPDGVLALEIDIVVLGGRVDIRLPHGWQIGPGRVIERAVALTGTLDWPSMTKPSPFGVAQVRRSVSAEPASGSVMPRETTFSPASNGRRKRSRCSAVAYSASVRIAPKLPACTTSALRGQAAATAWMAMTASSRVPPWPPFSSATVMPRMPDGRRHVRAPGRRGRAPSAGAARSARPAPGP